jgi:hypothetical protein
MNIISNSRAHFSMRLGMKVLLAVLLSIPINLLAQNQQTITGTIMDGRTNSPMADVSVMVKGSGTGAKTNANGAFTIKAKKGDVLVLSFAVIRHMKWRVETQTNITYTLKESTSKLDEVVVIGYGTSKRKDLTGAVSSVSAKEIAAAPVANVAQAMQGKLAGVSVISQDGRPNAEVSIRIRGEVRYRKAINL